MGGMRHRPTDLADAGCPVARHAGISGARHPARSSAGAPASRQITPERDQRVRAIRQTGSFGQRLFDRHETRLQHFFRLQAQGRIANRREHPAPQRLSGLREVEPAMLGNSTPLSRVPPAIPAPPIRHSSRSLHHAAGCHVPVPGIDGLAQGALVHTELARRIEQQDETAAPDQAARRAIRHAGGCPAIDRPRRPRQSARHPRSPGVRFRRPISGTPQP